MAKSRGRVLRPGGRVLRRQLGATEATKKRDMFAERDSSRDAGENATVPRARSCEEARRLPVGHVGGKKTSSFLPLRCWMRTQMLSHGRLGPGTNRRVTSLLRMFSPEVAFPQSQLLCSSVYSSLSSLLRVRQFSLASLKGLVSIAVLLLSSLSVAHVVFTGVSTSSSFLAPVSSSLSTLSLPPNATGGSSSAAADPAWVLFAAATPEEALPASTSKKQRKGNEWKVPQFFDSDMPRGTSKNLADSLSEPWAASNAPAGSLGASDEKPKSTGWVDGFLSWVATSTGVVGEEDGGYESEPFVLSLTLFCNAMPTAFRRLYSHLPVGITAADVLDGLVVGAPWLGGPGGSLLHLSLCVSDHDSFRLTAYRGSGRGPPLEGADLSRPLSDFRVPADDPSCRGTSPPREVFSAEAKVAQDSPVKQVPSRPRSREFQTLQAEAETAEGGRLPGGEGRVRDSRSAWPRPTEGLFGIDMFSNFDEFMQSAGLRVRNTQTSETGAFPVDDPSGSARTLGAGSQEVLGGGSAEAPDPRGRAGCESLVPKVSLVVAVDVALNEEDLAVQRLERPLGPTTNRRGVPDRWAPDRSLPDSDRGRGEVPDTGPSAGPEGPVKSSGLVLRVPPGSRPSTRRHDELHGKSAQLARRVAEQWRRSMLERVRKRTEEIAPLATENLEKGAVDLQSTSVEHAADVDANRKLRASVADPETQTEVEVDAGTAERNGEESQAKNETKRFGFFRWLFGNDGESHEVNGHPEEREIADDEAHDI
ncbi:putative transmembrane protein [Toxoplasma gondii FOU]|uniref:Putative transmembrane protein n=3 Tax=Toxoplasma gondii TaxID=5811 RepID=A0A086JZY6_TOXGO|nr:putative transmembrane protein [Toxoplasma gondii FOU]PUA85008.1 putative transmembrane protein [Toxoplasma gondii TgCATBr9]RQX68428.1 putative transmembrane protein [Toxoplasma gondii CAST]